MFRHLVRFIAAFAVVATASTASFLVHVTFATSSINFALFMNHPLFFIFTI